MTDDARPQLRVTPILAGGPLRVSHVAATAAMGAVTEPLALASHLLVLPYEGAFVTHVDDGSSWLTAGAEALVVPAGVRHHYRYPDRRGDRCVALTWDAEAVDEGLPTATHARSFLAPPDVLLQRERLRGSILDGALEPLEIEEQASQLVRVALGACDQRHPPSRISARQRHAVDRVRSAVVADYARAWTLRDMARIACVSPHHLARLFRRVADASLHDYVQRVRLDAALGRLADRDLPLATIATDLGFASHSHFTARFRRRFGVTPQQWRTSQARPARIVTAAAGKRVT
jgi:AraC-like DNA-binding protein